jgi:heat shock transcription factor
VLDEDEFAKKLIPELFKHNNYASFVRQLNMYGFHKRVGLSDNSMKASERKNKSPSEYYNPYFKRGHPNLLWLINKPKSGKKNTGKNPKQGDDVDSDDDGVADETYIQPSFPAPNNQLHRTVTPAEVGPLPPKKDLVLVKTQLDKLQQQQVAISQLIDRLRREHAQLMTQAAVFQTQHERHENSINAILNFLANVFRKSLEEQGGAQSVSELLASIIPGAQSQMPQGSVVDLGDFETHPPQEASNVVSPPKRQPRLLPPIPMQQGKAATVSPASTAATTPQPQYQFPRGSVSEIFDASPSDSSTPAYIKNELQTNPHEGMMKIINDTNTNSGSSRLDLPDMASKTNATMSHEQRSKMLNMMAGRVSTPGVPANNNPSSASTSSSSSTSAQQQNTNMALSPILSSVPAPPSMYQMQSHQAEIDALQQMQRDQAAKIDELSHMLGPLSPLRHIPDIDDIGDDDTGGDGAGGGAGTGTADYFDLNNVDLNSGMDDFLNPQAFGDVPYGDVSIAVAPPMTNSTDGNDFNFGLDGVGGGDGDGGGASIGVDFGGGAGGGLDVGAYEGGGRIFDAASPNHTPSPAGTEEIPRDDLGSPGPGTKRRRVQ